MKKQRKMEYESPNISEVELLSGFMVDVAGSIPDMKVQEVVDDDFWAENKN